MTEHPDQDVAVYVVWSSQLGAEERHVPEAATLMPDPRARHYWDPEMAVGRAYQAFLEIPQPAWDVWMLFGRDARWTGTDPPEPAWWEHQLSGAGLPAERVLDPDRFARKAAALVEGGGT